MNILHILEDFSINNGGVTTVVENLHSALKNKKHKSVILSPNCKYTSKDVYQFRAKKIWKYSKVFKNELQRVCLTHDINIIHIHGVWMYPQYIAAKYAIKSKIPFVVSSHGMYEPWLWENGRVKKKVYFKLLIKRLFCRAAIIHTITSQETKSIRKVFYPHKINTFEIPNLINLNMETPNLEGNSNKKRYILYLGRLDQIKGIDTLINSFSQIHKNNNVNLFIAGGFNDYKNELESLVKKLKIQDKVKFLGLIEDEKIKNELYSNCWVFVSPSHSEVIGMVNLEAAMCKAPVITTHQTGLYKEWSINGGVLINPVQEELTEALEKSLNWSISERENRGENLFEFVKKNYSWSNRMDDWLKLYNAAKKNKEV